MAKLTMRPSFELSLTLDQLRLVLKALGGRLKDEDYVVAKNLCDEITAQRAEELERTAAQLRKALENP
jgi:hypothetical protein